MKQDNEPCTKNEVCAVGFPSISHILLLSCLSCFFTISNLFVPLDVGWGETLLTTAILKAEVLALRKIKYLWTWNL